MTLKRTDFHGFFILLFFICEHLFVSVFFCACTRSASAHRCVQIFSYGSNAGFGFNENKSHVIIRMPVA